MTNFSKIRQSTALVRAVQAAIDIGILFAAFIAAYLLRFDFSIPEYLQLPIVFQCAAAVFIQFILLRTFMVHKFIWRYVSIPEMNRIGAAILLAAFPMLAARLAFGSEERLLSIPLSVIFVDSVLAAIGIVGARLLRRELHDSFHRSETSRDANGRTRPVLLIGAGKAGVMALSEIKGRGDMDIEVRGFVDDDRVKNGAIINGVRVLGSTKELPGLVRDLEIDHVIISIARAEREDFQRILGICRSIPVRVRTIPGLYELLQEKVNVSRIRDIQIEDLLGRPPVQLEGPDVREFLTEKTVMVTGAGGSIGSELARKIAVCRPERLLLVERSEFALFEISRRMAREFPEIETVPVLRDVTEKRKMARIFWEFKPEIVFHAAAFKHVPLMEDNASEALRNNVLGTNVVGELSGEHDAEAFVLISTDKAVDPASVMGATKRMSELVVQDLNSRFPTRYAAVRFGNVIGSAGSVIPIFRDQIRNGGPVTVTHPEMERFFMTISEACQLVLQAGAMGSGGEIFVLDMGEPVRILDLAKETIRLSGLEPGKDIEIVFTGTRPGEKMSEILQNDAERLESTGHAKINVCRIAAPISLSIAEVLEKARSITESDCDESALQLLSESLSDSGNGYRSVPSTNGDSSAKAGGVREPRKPAAL